MKRGSWAKSLPLTIMMGVLALGMGCSGGAPLQVPLSNTDGDARRTFSESLPQVSTAALSALHRMGIKVEAQERTEQKEIIRAKAADLRVEVQLDAISPTSTRMQAVAKQGLATKDPATATEIVLQTEKAIHGGWSLWR